MGEDKVRIDNVSIDLDNIADTLDELEIPKKWGIEAWHKDATWIELGDICGRNYMFDIDGISLDGKVSPARIWFSTHADIKVDRKTNREDINISATEVLSSIKGKCFRWAGHNKETSQDVAGLLQIANWEEEHYKYPAWGYWITIKGNVIAVQKNYPRHIESIIEDGFIEVDEVEFVSFEDGRNLYKEFSPWIKLDEYTNNGQYDYTFRVDKSGLGDNCASIELDFDWPTCFTPDKDAVDPFNNVMNKVNDRYIMWHGKDKLGGSVCGVLCFKNIDNQSATGVGGVEIMLGGTRMYSQNSSVNYNVNKHWSIKNTGNKKLLGTYYSREDEIGRVSSSSNFHLTEHGMQNIIRGQSQSERHLLMEKLLAKIDADETSWRESLKSIMEALGYLADIDSYRNKENPYELDNFSTQLTNFIANDLNMQGYIGDINTHSRKIKECAKPDCRLPYTFSGKMLVDCYDKIKHRLLPYLDKEGFEYRFEDNYSVPYLVIKDGNRKYCIFNLSRLRDAARQALKDYFSIPYGKCKDDWECDEIMRDKALDRFMKLYPD